MRVLPELPAGWTPGRVKDFASFSASTIDKKEHEGQVPVRLCNYVDVYYNDRITNDLSFMAATASPAEIARFSVLSGDVAITKDSETADDIGIPAYVPEDLPGVVYGYHLYVLRPRRDHSGRYLKWLFDSDFVRAQLSTRANGLTRVGLGQGALGSLPIPIPPGREQRRIAEFLDRETAQIDELIAKQEQLISTLAERLQSRVEMLVTGADELGSNGRETGVEWWPRLPANWGAPKVTHHFEVVLGKMLDAGREPVAGELAMPYVRAANIQESELRLDDLNSMPMTAPEIARLDLLSGDLLVVEGGAVGVNQYLQDDLPGISFQKTVNRVRPRGAGSSEYLGLVLDVLRWRGVIDMICNKSTIAHFTAEKLAALRVPWPPVSRQFEIAQEVRALRNDVSLLSERAQDAVGLLRERRQALISAAVTRQINVGVAS